VRPRLRRLGIGTMFTKVRLGWIWERSDRAFYLNALELAPVV
jgi:hypothetical protein